MKMLEWVWHKLIKKIKNIFKFNIHLSVKIKLKKQSFTLSQKSNRQTEFAG